MHSINAASAVMAARAALWNWRASDDTLTIRADPGGPFSAFGGAWRMEAFLQQVEGLARGPLRVRLASGQPGDAIDLRLAMANGVSAHFVGSYYDLGLARGLIVSGDAMVRAVSGAEQVEPVFQPIRRVDTLEIVGFEALARFRLPDGRLVGPDTLLAEGGDTDWTAIAPVMLRRSAKTLAALRAAGRDVFMQVNLSASELAEPILVEEVAALVRECDLPRGALRIELTEQTALRDHAEALGALAAFQAAGAGVVLDDFGAGHSSFAWLAELPADGVKLDPRLTQLLSQPRAAGIVAGLTRLIQSLDLTVTAEGVENREDIARLRAIGCDYVQGFALDMPLEAGELDAAFGRSP
jgi:EAL domain-containing protein (putative c-di-GMP-specific phosphodiesterase class I)